MQPTIPPAQDFPGCEQDTQKDEGGNATRRDFIKAVGATGILLGAPPLLPPEASAQTPPPAGTYAGNIYTIASGGQLYFFQDLARNGLAYFANGGSAQSIGSGWSFTHVFCGGDGIIYAIDGSGNLYFYKDLSRDGTSSWHAASGQVIGTGWNFDFVFSGGNGVIYAIDGNGDLYFYKDLARNGTSSWHAASGQVISSGWSFDHVFSGGNGIIYAVDGSGDLYFYKDLARNGSSYWHAASGQVIGNDFNYVHIFSGGNGVIYAVDGSGNLFFYQDLAQDGGSKWFHDGDRQQIASGWTYTFLMADDADTAFASATSPVLGTGPLQGYSIPQSVSPGEEIKFHVRTTAATFDVIYQRLRKTSAGDGDDSVSFPLLALSDVDGRKQPINSIHVWKTGCNWDADFSLTVPGNWTSGIYAAKCVDPATGHEFYIPFIVRPAEPSKPLAVLISTNTWNAYNSWGGRSNYTDPNGVVLSFERPNPGATPFDGITRTAASTPTSQAHLTLATLWILRWLEDAEYEFDVYSDLDFHLDPEQFETYNAIILDTHPEYWSVTMRENMVDFLAQDEKKLIYLGGNGLFETIDYSDDFGANTTRIKLRGGNPAATRSPYWFRNLSPTPLPERQILGVAYEFPNNFAFDATFAPYKVAMPSHRFFNGISPPVALNASIGSTGLNGAASGWEMDTATGTGAVSGIQILATGSNVINPGMPGEAHYGADMTYYETGSGGFVFSIGSICFGGSLAVDAKLQKILGNVLDECI
jgi:N,N-dimethylformamidase